MYNTIKIYATLNRAVLVYVKIKEAKQIMVCRICVDHAEYIQYINLITGDVNETSTPPPPSHLDVRVGL